MRIPSDKNISSQRLPTKNKQMKNIAKRTLRFVLGFVLFVVGIGLFYAGCKYMGTEMSGKSSKVDGWIYALCFLPSLVGIGMMWDAVSKKKEETPITTNNEKQP
jgi:uncharacterized transporter YbjL